MLAQAWSSRVARRLTLFLAFSLAGEGALLAQDLPGQLPFSAPSASSPTFSAVPLSSASPGIQIAPDRGPWVLGDVVFRGLAVVSEYGLRSRIRARRGTVFTPSDLQGDVSALLSMPGILSAEAALYAMPDQPVPESYRAIAVSTMMVRVVYSVSEKPILLPGLSAPATAQAAAPVEIKEPPVPLSGVVMMPTAYRGINQYNQPGLALDVAAQYFIGRLYGKFQGNENLVAKRNYIDRIGVWFLTTDGKMQIQSETAWRPALSVGARGILTFRDAPQPTVQSPTTSVNVSADTTRILSDGYVVATKKLLKLITSVGFAQGNAGDRVALLTEYLSPTLLRLQGYGTNQSEPEAKSRSVLFGSLLYLPKPQLPLAIEIMKPNGMPLDPILMNLRVGSFLKLNFDLAYLKFRGGYELLGVFQFRYTHFPRTYRPKS